MRKKMTQTLFSSSLVPSRSIWTRASAYPVKYEASWRLDTLCFPTSTYNGSKLSDFNFFNIFTMPRSHNLLFRGMSKKESDCVFNKKMDGFVGREPSVFRSKDKEKMMIAHQSGDIMGISTSMSLDAAKSWSRGKEHEIMVFDLNNIPKRETHYQKYEAGELGVNPIDGEYIDFSGEAECTLSGAHISACVARVEKVGLLFWKIEFNPLYVDVKMLPPDLRREFKDVVRSFYDLIQTKKPDSEKVKEYEKKELNFYLKVADTLGYSEEHKAAIVSHFKGKGVEIEYKEGPDLK